LKKSKRESRAGGLAQDVGPEFKPQYCKTKQTSGNKLENIKEMDKFLET
jgi:hypothetical protein